MWSFAHSIRHSPANMASLTDKKRPTINPTLEAVGQLREKHHQGGNGGSRFDLKARLICPGLFRPALADISSNFADLQELYDRMVWVDSAAETQAFMADVQAMQ
jgi:hypothetical protein